MGQDFLYIMHYDLFNSKFSIFVYYAYCIIFIAFGWNDVDHTVQNYVVQKIDRALRRAPFVRHGKDGGEHISPRDKFLPQFFSRRQ